MESFGFHLKFTHKNYSFVLQLLDGVTRLGKVYIKLCSAGSIIFKKWAVRFHCDASKKVHTEVDFGLSSSILKGSREMKVNVTAQIKELCKFLEDCLKKWTSEINEKRECYYYLNHFTTEQLVILRKEIAKVCNGESGDKIIYPMLDSVKKGCLPTVKKMFFFITVNTVVFLFGNLNFSFKSSMHTKFTENFIFFF